MSSDRPDPYARIRRRRLLLRAGVVVALLAAVWYFWPDRNQPEGLSESIEAIALEMMDEGPIAGVSVGVARGGRVLHAEGYGRRDLENDLPATAETVYNVGSITKQFTAAAILQLVEEDRVRLDAPITEYLPDLPLDDDVTIRSLLSHTAGVRNFTTMESWWRTMAVERSPEELVAVFAGEPLDFEPRTAFSYSNSGYVLLGRVVERVSGRPYGGYLNARLFEPLDLSATSYCDDRALVPNRARGYQLVDGDFARARYVSMSQAYAAGAICSNVEDLLRWVRLLTSGAVLRRESYQRMVTPAELEDGRTIEYGFGLALSYLEGHRRITHVGGMRGFAGFLAHYPDDDLRVVVLTNTEGAAAAELESRIARLVLSLEDGTTRDLPLSADELDRYTGTFDMRLAEVTLTSRDGRLRALIAEPGIEDMDLLHQGDHRFQAAGHPQTTVEFEMSGDSAVAFVLEHQGITLRGRRITAD